MTVMFAQGAPLAYVDHGDGTNHRHADGAHVEKLSWDGSMHDKDTRGTAWVRTALATSAHLLPTSISIIGHFARAGRYRAGTGFQAGEGVRALALWHT